LAIAQSGQVFGLFGGKQSSRRQRADLLLAQACCIAARGMRRAMRHPRPWDKSASNFSALRPWVVVAFCPKDKAIMRLN
jgi:hypothetical protein